MAYNVEFSQNAKKELDNLERVIAIRILKKVREIKNTPFHYIKRLVGSELYSLRVGDYRILMTIIHTTIFIVRIGHRSDVYE
ncbi:type II toxin-antitoxin system RelE/ParE family toxin [Candidatus Woesearchaeota archaeon]|nr:type II toxin-antitoxin system RelE/ParE family toxin [Candidatus Woesearchaeota archaeon]